MVFSVNRLIGRHGHGVNSVYFIKFSLEVSAVPVIPASFFVKAKIILEGYGSESSGFLLNRHTLLSFNRLMKPPRTTFARAEAFRTHSSTMMTSPSLTTYSLSRLKKRLGSHGSFKMMNIFHALVGINIFHTERFLGLFYSFVSQSYLFEFFINFVVGVF